MTSIEALEALRPPLIFGDPGQIRAVDFVVDVESCRKAMRNCRCPLVQCQRCDGEETITCRCNCGDEHEAVCGVCTGGVVEDAECLCVLGFAEDVRIEARKMEKP